MSGRRRRSRKPWFVIGGVFIAVFLFTFLVHNDRQEVKVEAASLANFDPGYIISDYQMGNYTSMTEKEIQAFLTKKNPCNNKDEQLYNELTETYPNYKWHFEDGHFICLSEEKFGEGEEIGKGETAAHIIWQTAQDYKINPQVLIVLLQKEQGLITDDFPHNIQYRAATGYGCPDTAPCSSQYYGFKNQVRKAAALFRTVLDGGWTNFPLGNNFVQYNPSVSCGGSVVNIKNLATSALYRYTPYQPSAETLAAGYGTVSNCGAYGNRNFYLYFEDWFGGTTQVVQWIAMETPRYMVSKNNAKYYDMNTSKYLEAKVGDNKKLFFVDKSINKDGKMCLRTKEDNAANKNKCVIFADLIEYEPNWVMMESPRFMEADQKAVLINLRTEENNGSPKKIDYYDKKILLPDGKMCLKANAESGALCVKYESLKETNINITSMLVPRYLVAKDKKIDIWDPLENKVIDQIETDKRIFYDKKVVDSTGQTCLISSSSEVGYGCVSFTSLSETWIEMERPREMKMIIQSYKIDATDLKENKDVILTVGLRRKFVMKRFMPNNEWCLQTEYDYERKTNNCIRDRELGET